MGRNRALTRLNVLNLTVLMCTDTHDRVSVSYWVGNCTEEM